MAELMFPNIVGNGLAALQQGQQQAQQSQFNALAGQAYSASPEQRNALLSQAVGIDPARGVQLGSLLAQQDKQRQETQQAQQQAQLKQLGGAARLLLQARMQAQRTGNPDIVQGAWNSVRPLLMQKFPGGNFSPTWDDATMTPIAFQVAAAAGIDLNDIGKPINVGANDKVYDPLSGKIIADNPKDVQEPDQIRTLRLLQQNPELLRTEEQLRAAMRAPSSGGEGGKAADWVIQQGADGQIYRINKFAGPAMPVMVQGAGQGMPQPLIGANSFKAATTASNAEKAKAAQADAVASYDQAISQIDGLLNSPGASWLGTFQGDVAGMIPHTDTRNAQEQLNTVKNQVLLNTLRKLKSLSATGASGFGALSDQEGRILQNSIANLEKSQSHQQIVNNLNTIKDQLRQSRNRIANHAVDVAPVSNAVNQQAPAQNTQQGWSIQRVD